LSGDTPVQRIRIAGNDYVLMLEDEYHALANAATALSKSFKSPSAIGEVKEGTPIFSGEDSKLRTWRKFRGLTQKELASRVGAAHSYIAQIENGTRIGKPALWRSIADTLNVTIDEILPDL